MSRGAETIEAQIAALQSATGLASTTTSGLESAAGFAEVGTPVANVTALAAIAATARADGMLVWVISDVGGAGSWWQFSAAATATDSTSNIVVAPAAGTGAWLRACGKVCLSIAVTKDNTDNQTIFTVPTGAKLRVTEAFWEVGTSWTGGTTPAIGVHASPTGWTTKGDILGGASGDLTATLVSSGSRMVGTVGAKLTAHTNDRLIMIAGDTFKFDRIADAFTAGAANVRVIADLIANPGA